MNSLHWKNERGASLVEILVVMVVLVVGIFTIIRIFPVGFDVLEYSSHQTVGQRLAEAEIEYWRKNPENLPEGIVAITPAKTPFFGKVDSTARPTDFVSGTGASGDNTTVRDDTKRRLQQAGMSTTEDNIDRWVGQNRTRRILGEVTRIPAPTPVNWGGGAQSASVYSLAYAPIEWPANNPNDQTVADGYLQIRGNPLTAFDVTAIAQSALPGTINQLRPSQYGVDYKKALLYFPFSNKPRQFIASYTYRILNGLATARNDVIYVGPTSGNPRGTTVPFSTVQLGVNTPGNPVQDKNFQRLEPDTMEVSPKYRYLRPGDPFTSDPYEYRALATYGTGVQFTGAIAFNPVGYNKQERAPGGAVIPLRAHIDYTVRDWRILHQDVSLPASAPFRARLVLNHLKQANVTTGDDDLIPWTGLTDDASKKISVIGIDLSNGDLMADDSGKVVVGAGNGIAVDYSTGLLTFPANTYAFSAGSNTAGSKPIAGHTIRIFYAVEGDWAIVPQKAYDSYDVLSSNFLNNGSDQVKAIPVGNAVVFKADQDGRGKYIEVWFPTADEGKAVNLNYTYRTNDKRLRTVYGEEAQISSQERDTNWSRKVGSNINEADKPYIKIYLPGNAAVANVNSDFQINQMRGVSFRAVAVWRDRSRWRQQALTAHLNRSSAY